MLIVAGTKNVLVDQTQEALGKYQESEDIEEVIAETEEMDIDEEEVLKEKSFLYRTGRIKDPNANVRVGTIQTVRSAVSRELVVSEDYDFSIVDEVHNVGTRLRQETLQDFRKIGFTATPFRHSGVMRSPEDYGFTVIRSLTLPEAQEKRFLPPLIGMQFDTTGLVEEVPMTRTGQIDFKELERILKRSPDLRQFIERKIASVIIDPEGRRYKSGIVVNYVWEAEEIAEELLSLGISVGIAVNKSAARKIHSEKIPSLDAIERIKLHQDDERNIQVLISPYIAGEGYDVPVIEALFWASPTDSPLRYTQYTGRLARRHNGKLFGILGDFLYQTSQYAWSYNMGMWMKGNVRQLENGLLYLGPEMDIEALRNLPILDNIRSQSDTKPLSDLGREGLIVVQEGEFVISHDSLNFTFYGNSNRIMKIAEIVLSELREQGLVVKRLRSNQIVTVVADTHRFKTLMAEKGVRLASEVKHPLQPLELQITHPALKSLFVGDTSKLYPLALQIIDEIITVNPNLVTQRRLNTNQQVTVVLDRELFIKLMKQRGIQLRRTIREADSNSENLFILSTKVLLEIFTKYPDFRHILKDVLDILCAEDPSMVVSVKSNYGPSILGLVNPEKNRKRFIQEMLKRGAKLKRSTKY